LFKGFGREIGRVKGNNIGQKKCFKSKFEGGIGFRSIRAFSEAILATQVWRMHTNPNSLIYRWYIKLNTSPL